MDYDFLPPIHRPGGARARHDDYPVGLRWVPRTWTSFPLGAIPHLRYGNQRYWHNPLAGTDWWGDNLDSSQWGPKPIPRPGEWCLMIVPTLVFGITWRLPCFSITTKNGWHFRIGLARFSDDYSDEEKRLYWYSELKTLAVRRLK